MSGPRIVTQGPSTSSPKIVTQGPEPRFADRTSITKFPQTTRRSDDELGLYGFQLSDPAYSTDEERLISQQLRDQIPEYVIGAAKIYPAIALQNPRFLAGLGIRAGVGKLASAAYVAMQSPQAIEDVIFGVPSSAQLKVRRGRLVSDPQFLADEIARLDAENRTRMATLGGHEGAAIGRMLQPRATAEDVFREIDGQILRMEGEEAAASHADREGASTLSKGLDLVLNHTPQTSRAAAAANLAREVGSFVGPQALLLFGARVANDVRNFVRMSNDPDVSAEETADLGGAAAQGMIILKAIGDIHANRAARARAEREQIESAESVVNAQDIAARLSLERQALEHNVPKRVVELDQPRANLVATLRQAHQELRPDGVTVIQGVDNPMIALQPNPSVRQVMSERIAYNSRTKTVYLFGENNPNNTPENRESIRRTGFYPGQRVSYAGADFSFTGQLDRGLARITNPETQEGHNVRIKDLRLSGQNDNLTLSSVSQDAAFRLYEQLKKAQPEAMGPREVDAIINSLGEILALPKAQYGALREYILSREAQRTPKIIPEAEIDAMIKNVLSPEELAEVIREGTILMQQPKTPGEGPLEVPEFIKGGKRRIQSPIYTIVNPDALPPNLREKYRSLEHTRSMIEWEREELKGTKVVDEQGAPKVVYHGTPVLRETPLGPSREAFSRDRTGPENLWGQGAGYFTEAPEITGGELTPKRVKEIQSEINTLRSEFNRIESITDIPTKRTEIIKFARRMGLSTNDRGYELDRGTLTNEIEVHIQKLENQITNDTNLGYATPKGGINSPLVGYKLAEDIHSPAKLGPDGDPLLLLPRGRVLTEVDLFGIHNLGIESIKVESGNEILNVFVERPAAPQVLPVRLKIERPFDLQRDVSGPEITEILNAAEVKVKEVLSNDIPLRADVLLEIFSEKLEDRLNRNVKNGATSGQHIWELLESVLESNLGSDYYIPEGRRLINEILEAAGYDGITHIGGNLAGRGKLRHRVWIPFREEQIFSPYGRVAPEAFSRMQSNILIEHTLDNIAKSNNLSVSQVGEGYDIRGEKGELLRHITSPEQAADFINSIQQPSGPDLTPIDLPPVNIPPEVKAMISSNNDGPFVPYNVRPHTLTERIITNMRRQIFEGAMRQWKDIAAITKGAVDLETLAREMQNAFRLTDSLIAHELKKAGIDELERQERSLTRQERDDSFKANETLSVKEAEELAGPLGVKYADILMGLNSNEHPLDIRRLIEFTRFASELVDTSKIEKWDKARLQGEFNRLLDSYEFSTNNQAAIPIVEAIRRQSKKKIDLHNVARLLDARMNPQEAASRDEFMAKKGFNSTQRAIADKVKKVLGYFTGYNGLESDQQIVQYMAHYRSQPRLLNEHQIPRRRSAEEIPPSIESIEEMIRSGELGVYDTSPSRMLRRYIRSSVMNKHLKPIYDLQLREMNKRISEIADPDVRKLAKRSLNYFTEGLLRSLDVEDRVHNKLFRTIAHELASSKLIPEGVKKQLLNVSERAITNLVNTSIYNMIAAYQGGKIGNVPRDSFNALQMANTWFGPRFALEFINRSYGKIKITANGLDIDTMQEIQRGRALGIIGQEFHKRKPPIPRDHRNPVVKLAELYNTFAYAAIALSGQQPTHDLLSIGAYKLGRENALRVIEKLRTERNLTPEKKTEILDEELSLDMMSPEFQKKFDSLLRSGTESDITNAADIYGREVVHKIMPPYGYGEQPRGWRTIPGRLFGLYGRYQIHILDQLHDMASYGRNNARKRAALERFLAVEASRIVMSRALGVDSQSWSALGLWQGSPQYQFAQDIITAIKDNDEDKLAAALERIGASQIPMSSLVSVLSSAQSPEEGLMRILTLIKPAKE